MGHQISTTIDVRDLTSALDFYIQALSCELKKKHSDDWAVVSIGGHDINLLEKREGTVAAAEQERTYERHWTPVHLDFGVESVPIAMELVRQHGGSVEATATSEDIDFAPCADPFGNGFCLVKF